MLVLELTWMILVFQSVWFAPGFLLLVHEVHGFDSEIELIREHYRDWTSSRTLQHLIKRLFKLNGPKNNLHKKIIYK